MSRFLISLPLLLIRGRKELRLRMLGNPCALTFPASGARLQPLAGARCFTRVRVRWGVGRRLHLAPQRHVGGSPLTQQTATKPKPRHTAYVTKTNDPYVGSSMKAPPRRRTAKTPMTTQPCHTLGRPQPQP